MTDKLTSGSGIMCDPKLGTILRQSPGEEMGEVATRVALEVVAEITDRIGLIALNTWGKVLTIMRHSDVYMIWFKGELTDGSSYIPVKSEYSKCVNKLQISPA